MMMLNKSICLSFLLVLLLPVSSLGQQIGDAQRLNELKKLRDELKQTDSLRGSDLIVVINEKTVIESARQIVGLEIALSNGTQLRITSVDGDVESGAATIKIGVQAKSTVIVNLVLTGRLGAGEIKDGAFRMPFQITDVSLASNFLSSIFLRTLLGGWLTSKKWNEELPPLELPLEISQSVKIPAGRVNVDGSPPMEISTPEYASPLNFNITSLLVLDGRLALGLKMIDSSSQTRDETLRVSRTGANDKDLQSLKIEIARLSDNLNSRGDLDLRISRRVITRVLEQIASAHAVDFVIKLKPGRLRTEEVDTVVKVVNYTDVESGDGRADISKLSVERIGGGVINLRLSADGEVDAKVRGREYGIPYRLSPHTTFSIKERLIPLQLVSEGERVVLKAVPGASLPINLRFSLKVAGRDIGINRNRDVEVDKILGRIGIPTFFGQEVMIPRKMEVDAGGNLYVTRREKYKFVLSGMRVEAGEDDIDIVAGISFSPY